MKRAIVLSGGGARGAYEIGVWKALRRMHIKFNIVTGTSVGALNGALMVQKSYLKALWLWRTLTFKQVFNDDINYDYRTSVERRAIYKKYAKAIIKDKGMDVTKLESNISKFLDEKKFKQSDIDFGLVTVNISNFKPLELMKKDIPDGKLKDYLIASATCYPAFKVKKIDGSNYIDGAYYDNVPINLAIEMGAEEIIAVDLNALGLKRKITNDKVKIIYITPHNNIGPTLIFHKDLAKRGIRYGFNDTMKTFGRLDGHIYTFHRHHLKHNASRYMKKYSRLIEDIFQNNSHNIMMQLLKKTTYRKKISITTFNNNLEFLGKIFDIDDTCIYRINRFNKLLISKIEEMPSLSINYIEKTVKNNRLRTAIDKKSIIRYIYDQLFLYNKGANKKKLSSLALILPREFLCAMYLYIIKYN